MKDNNKVLIGIIITLILLLVFAFKSILTVAENKTILIEVPSIIEPGKYAIGPKQATNGVHKMWAKVWASEIGNFSYKNIDKKIKGILPFIDPMSIYKNKMKLLKTEDYVISNYITQKFHISDVYIKTFPKGRKRVVVVGRIFRDVGDKPDAINDLPYYIGFITFVRNGQVYIQSIDSGVIDYNDGTIEKRLKDIKSYYMEKADKDTNLFINNARINGDEDVKLAKKKAQKAQKKHKKDGK